MNAPDQSTLRPAAQMLTAGGGYSTRLETLRQFAPTSWVLEMLAEYNAIVRVNRSEEWDTVRAVAYCEDGMLGAYGEICELIRDLSGQDISGLEDGILRPLFAAYQSALRAEVVTLEGDR